MWFINPSLLELPKTPTCKSTGLAKKTKYQIILEDFGLEPRQENANIQLCILIA